MEHLSDIELYYTSPEFIKNEMISLKGEEFHHAVNVMRNSSGDVLHVTDGEGKIYRTEIVEINRKELRAIIKEKIQYENPTNNIWFCIPHLKNLDRLKIAFEKCVELGITNFVLFTSKHTIPKKINLEKFRKTTLAAMKQSLRAYLPKIISATFSEIMELPYAKILFDQNSKNIFDGNIDIKNPAYYLFGPEGGFDDSEINTVIPENRFCLSENRLRSETAVIKCAALIKLY